MTKSPETPAGFLSQWKEKSQPHNSNGNSKPAIVQSPIALRSDSGSPAVTNIGPAPDFAGDQGARERPTAVPARVRRERKLMGLALLRIGVKAFTRPLSKATRRTIAMRLGGIVRKRGDLQIREDFYRQHGTYPPFFLTISPGKACNLKCVGCYADAGPASEKLDWVTFNRILTEAKTLWGIRFFVLSGGEPLAYRSEAKGVLDAAALHPDCFFLMFTNGTLISDDVARQLAMLGNVTPAISVEGWRERTDARRGYGVFDKVLVAMERLRRSGVLFGTSVTATRENAEELLSDDFIKFFFEKQGALYQWIFHYLPIGRSAELDLMPTPEQRLWMWRRSWELISHRRLFLADFWNHGTASFGCISGGLIGGGGYLHIDWNGAVSPCVFVPFSPVNIRQLYSQGKTLNDVWSEPFFNSIRSWQHAYWRNGGNWMTPCLIRDHYGELLQMVESHHPQMARRGAPEITADPDYACRLIAYGQACDALSKPIWDECYLKRCGRLGAASSFRSVSWVRAQFMEPSNDLVRLEPEPRR